MPQMVNKNPCMVTHSSINEHPLVCKWQIKQKIVANTQCSKSKQNQILDYFEKTYFFGHTKMSEIAVSAILQA